ncbi:hypothetical protein GQ53DRAFT_128511, partial [Thozetella sp. PMI_491]
MPEPERRRRRPAVSCSLCRARKVRCDRERPCSNCVRSKNEQCIYENHSQPPRLRFGQGEQSAHRSVDTPGAQLLTPMDSLSGISRLSEAAGNHPSSLADNSTRGSAVASGLCPQDAQSIKSKIRELEEQLARVSQASTPASVSDASHRPETVSAAMTIPLMSDDVSSLYGQAHFIPRSVVHKTRLFGQSHWLNGIVMFGDIIRRIEPYVRKEANTVPAALQRCKLLARHIKARRTPQWPCIPTSNLPSKDVADELVDCYLRTTETVYRVLHVPTFRRDYEALWVANTEPDMGFIVLLKLVLANGAATYDNKFSLRPSALQWVYEAYAWLVAPEFKQRLGIQSLQSNILLLIAQEVVGVGEDSVWASAGLLLRTAISLGLHRDPSQLLKRSTFMAEMCRRLWNTILEIALQASLSSGGPPLISLDDFDTDPPGNFDDDQILAEDPVPKDENCFTQMSTAIALRKTFPFRLAVTRFLNELQSRGTYEEALGLDSELKIAYKTLCRTLHAYNSSPGLSPSQFEIRMVELIIHRYILSLHIPFYGKALKETVYAFSRKAAIDSALKIWYTLFPRSPGMLTQPQGNPVEAGKDDLEQLAIISYGFFRTGPYQAALIASGELKNQLEEEQGLSPTPLRVDLLSMVQDAKVVCLRSIQLGETNVKGYLLISLILAYIDGLRQGLSADKLPEFLTRAVVEVNETCLSLLEAAAGLDQIEAVSLSLDQASLDMSLDIGEGWGFIMPEAVLGPESADLMTWVFNQP